MKKKQTKKEKAYEAVKKILYEKCDIDPEELTLLGEPEIEYYCWLGDPDLPEPIVEIQNRNDSKMIFRFWDADDIYDYVVGEDY